MLSNLTAEMALLSCLMNAPLPTCTDIIQSARQEHFSTQANKSVFMLCCKVVGRKHEPDLLAVIAEAEGEGNLEEIGGRVRLTEIATYSTKSSSWKTHLDTLEELRFRRAAMEFKDSIAEKAQDMSVSVEELKDWTEKEVLRLDYTSSDTCLVTTKNAVQEAITNIEGMYSGEGKKGLPTGFSGIDRLLRGLKPSEMSIIAARPSVGKSAFMMQVAEHLALDHGKRVGIFSLEMSAASLVQRGILSRARMSGQDIEDKRVTPAQFSMMSVVAGEYGKANLFVEDEEGISIAQLKAKARRHHQYQPVDIFLIDYLQLLRGTSKRAKENREQEVSEISKGLKGLAKQLNTHVMVLAQLNRMVENRKSGRPVLSDLRESGSLEQDADVVALLSRKQDEDKEEDGSKSGPILFDIAKHRNGPTGDCVLHFNAPITRFELNF
jgi:replicative DNA helicase